jgi:single-stranded-DNA-specific exonuclease
LDFIRGARYRWHLAEADKALALNVASRCNLSMPIASAIVGRGLTDEKLASRFLFSSFERDVAHASLLKDAEKSVDRINKAIKDQEKILIFGDYDVDGMTSTSIALLSLIPLGAKINFALPNRVKDGYGISRKMVERAAKSNYKLIVTVDNGTSAFDAADAANEKEIDLIITDHHQTQDKIPPVFALVNPHQKGCLFPHKVLCGAGVIFKVMELLYEQRGLTLPRKVTELMMMGTIADVVPLLDENRYWVRQGLAQVNEGMSFSFSCLAENGKVKKERIGSQDIGFSIAPQLNALGRLDDPRDGVYFLASSDQRKVQNIAYQLKEINEKRKKVEATVFEQVDSNIKSGKIDIKTEHVIVDSATNWPPGVIGLVAGRLMNRYGRPAFLFHLTPTGMAKGSCRSIPEFNVFKALQKHDDLLTTFGGHACAAGLSLPMEHLAELKKRLTAQVAEQIPIEDLQPRLVADATMDLSEANKQIIHDLEMLEPFGNSNPLPLFLIKNVVLVRAPQLLKEKHLKCMIFSNGIVKPIIFFNRPELAQALEKHGDAPFNIAAHVIKNEWNDRISVELHGVDIAF